MPTLTSVNAADLISNSWLVAAALAEMKVRKLIADRVTLRSVPGAIEPVGDVARKGTKTLRVRFAGLGASLSMTTATNEADEATPASINIQTANPAVGRHYLALSSTQLAQIITPEGDIDPDGLAETFAEAWDGKFMDVLADTIDDFGTDVVNTSADDASMDDLYDVVDEFEENNIDGPIFGALAGKQISDIRNSSRAEGGPTQFRTDIQGLQGLVGFQFEVMGLHIFRVNKVKSSGGSRHGAFWAPGALGWAMGSTGKVKTSFGATKPAGLPMIIGYDFNEKAGTVDTVANAYFGEAILYDGLGRGFVTKA